MPLSYSTKKNSIYYTGAIAPANKQIDDLWLESNGIRSPLLWRWDGTYWRSDVLKWNGSQNNTTSAMKNYLCLDAFHGVYVRDVSISYFSPSATDNNNYWGYQLFFSSTGNNAPEGMMNEFYWNNWGANIPGNNSALFNNYINLSTRTCNFLVFAANRVGAAASATMAYTLSYELIRK